MNLAEFLKRTDTAVERMSREDLIGFIHELARTLHEDEREDFLLRLNTPWTGCAGNAAASGTESENGDESLLVRCREILEKLEKIEAGERCLTGFLNEEYDDWYDNGEEFLYEDSDGIGEIISRACELARQCIECGQYQPVRDMAEIMVGLKIMVGGEYLDYIDEPLDIEELNYHDLAEFDYKQFLVDALYAVYQTEKPEFRADALYEVIENSRRGDLTLEMVLQNGREISDLAQFLPLWISFLGERTGGKAGRLLQEAIALSPDSGELLQAARRFSRQHPGLYKQYLAKNVEKEEPERLLAVGEEALKTIENKYVIRSEIALLLSRIALKEGKQEKAEGYWLEAFRSDTSVENYLRLFMEGGDFSHYEAEAEQICQGAYEWVKTKEYRFSADGELRENLPDDKQIYMLGMLRGEFSFVRDSAMNHKENLGWSFTFMKCGLAAFLLLLLETEELQSGGREMLNRIVSGIGFEKEHFQKGLLRTIPEENREWFWKCFCRCKKTILLTAQEKNDYYVWVKELVKKRVAGIMDANRRNYYGECSAYIAALGEVTESRGERGGKQRVMSEFMDMYSRRYAFRETMRGYGMRDSRSK